MKNSKDSQIQFITNWHSSYIGSDAITASENKISDLKKRTEKINKISNYIIGFLFIGFIAFSIYWAVSGEFNHIMNLTK